MCVIVFVPSGTSIDDATLQQCYQKNPDGWGIMYHEDGKAHGIKDTSSFEDFLEHWNKIKDKVTHKVIHFRFATHGKVNKRNCHPFPMNTRDGEYMLMHNGVIGIPCINSELSDTWHYTRLLESIISQYPDPLDNEAVSTGISTTLHGSRLAIMRHDGTVHYYGTWYDHAGCMFSNLLWQVKPVTTYTATPTQSVPWGPPPNWAIPSRCPHYTKPTNKECQRCSTMSCMFNSDGSCCTEAGESPPFNSAFDDIIVGIQKDLLNEDYDNVVLTLSEHSITIKDLMTLVPDKDKWLPELAQAAIDIAV